jgi:hypothetical protein
MEFEIKRNHVQCDSSKRTIVLTLMLATFGACENGSSSNPDNLSTASSSASSSSSSPSTGENDESSDVAESTGEGGVEQGCAGLEPSLLGENSIFVTSDEDLKMLEGVVCIEDGLHIRGQVSTLSRLHALQKAGGIIISSTPLVSLAGLENLTKVGYLEIDRNPALESLSALANLQRVGDSLAVGIRSGGTSHFPEDGNDKLVNLSGLEGLRYAHSVHIASNDALVNVDALGGVAVPEDMSFSNNTMLAHESLQALATKLGLPEILRHCGCFGEALCPPDGD